VKPNNGGQGNKGDGGKIEKFWKKKSYRGKREEFEEEK